MTLKIKGKAHGEIDVKRFYLPGITLTSDCPNCSEINKMNMGDDYISFPSFNEEFGFGFYCRECSHEWEEQIILELKVKGIK